MYSVLIADDERIERRFLRGILEESDGRYLVAGEAENGTRTVALTEKLRPDIVLLDVNMPTLSGLEAARLIKRSAPQTTVIINSAYAEFDFAQKAISYGVDAYLVKPAERDLILSTLDGCVQRRLIGAEPIAPLAPPAACPYPYQLNTALLACLENHDVKGLRREGTAYVRFFERSYSDLAYYRLFIINTLFSIGQALQKSSIPPSLIALLGEHIYIDNISRARNWIEVLASLQEFFSRLVMLYDGCSPTQRSPIDPVVDYIDEHFAESLPLAELAAMVYLSPAYLSRRFHQEKNISLRGYITKRRMEEAVRLLQSTRLPIGEVAGACGFNSQSYFQKICKEQTGRTPTEIRQGASIEE